MFKLTTISLLALISTQALATTVPTCKIATLKDAKACMAKVAVAYPDYEEANDSMASDRKDVLKKVLAAIGLKGLVSKVDKADFVGAMLEHGDEHHIYYFLLKKGTAKPVELYDLNLVDLASMLTAPVTVKDMFLGTSFNGSDVKEEIEAAFEEAKENN